jgi:hypothetical protein
LKSSAIVHPVVLVIKYLGTTVLVMALQSPTIVVVELRDVTPVVTELHGTTVVVEPPRNSTLQAQCVDLLELYLVEAPVRLIPIGLYPLALLVPFLDALAMNQIFLDPLICHQHIVGRIQLIRHHLPSID